MGESVAGDTLRSALQSSAGVAKDDERGLRTSEIEVVDLARTDLMHEPLQEMITPALHLEPDALSYSRVTIGTRSLNPQRRRDSRHDICASKGRLVAQRQRVDVSPL